MKMLAVLLGALVGVGLQTPATANERPTEEPRPPRIAVWGPGVVVRSTGPSATAGRETAGPDTFVLYGGPDQLTEGKFQLADGTTPDWGDGSGLPGGPYGGGPAAWWPVDLTDMPVHWHQDTFHAENLNGNGAGNHSLWSGEPAGVPATYGWYDPPGYGNSWDDRVVYESTPLADPSVGQTVQLDFYFNIDVYDVTWDFFIVEYDSAGIWTEVLRLSESNRVNDVFPVPGLQFSTLQERPILFAGNDYGGVGSDRIRIRLRTTSDGAWSDQDGFAPTVAGLAQVDDITLITSQGTFTEDFEGPGPYLFLPEKSPFFGDFADVYGGFVDIDPCRDDESPLVGFVDYGQAPRNGPGASGTASTGGTISLNVSYGIPGHYVVNNSGGLDGEPLTLRNEIWSPEILWDLPGADDDADDIAGASLRFSVWKHLPLSNGIFYSWAVRSARADGPLGFWRRAEGYWLFGSNSTGEWAHEEHDFTTVIPYLPSRLQVAVSALDYSDVFQFPGADSTPSPMFDNVSVVKYRIHGPVLAADVADLAQDGFPVNGSIDVSSSAARDALDIPFDMAWDVNSGLFLNVPGDSVAFDAGERIPGSLITDLRMFWALQTNPLFEDAIRTAPSRPRDENVVAGNAGSVWTGEVVAAPCTDEFGSWIHERYFVDLPDVDFLYPGDVLHYYIRAIDDGGRVTTLPADTSGFAIFGEAASYDRTFTVRALPSLKDTAGTQPEVLVINDFGRRGGEQAWVSSFADLPYVEGDDYDSYTVQAPSSMSSNGIGSSGAHGAAPGQLSGYHNVFYFSGNLSAGLLSDGSNLSDNDKGDDLGVLRAWHELAGGRNAAYFGDFVASGNARSAAGLAFVTDVMGVQVVDHGLPDYVDGQVSPEVTPSTDGSPWYQTDLLVYGGCPDSKSSDVIRAGSTAVAGHWFRDGTGLPMTGFDDPHASVIHPTGSGIVVTFPFSFASLMDLGDPYIVPARTWLLTETLMYLFEHDLGTCIVSGRWPFCTEAPPERVPARLAVHPNPFNARTTVDFTAAPGSEGSVKVYNLRGETVRSLHRGEFRSTRFTWDGRDANGSAVASGIYLVRAEADGQVRTKKIALVK